MTLTGISLSTTEREQTFTSAVSPPSYPSRGEESISSTDLIKDWKYNLKRKSGTEDLFWYAKIWEFAC